MTELISGKNIIKTFGVGDEKNTVLNNVNIEIVKGEFVAIMGASGSGKSTLLFSLSGMDIIDSGAIYFEGEDLTNLSEKQLSDIRRTKMGFVFQQATMLKNLNLLDNIILPSVQDNRKNKVSIIKKARALMKQTGIAGLEKRSSTEVSGGQLQRASICRALMNSPQIIFADEPTGALNSKSAEEIMILLSTFHESGTAILLVTHDAKVASRADRVLFMKDGKVVSELQMRGINGEGIESREEQILLQMRDIGA